MFWICLGGEKKKNRRRNCTVEATNKRAPPTETEESTENTKHSAQQSRELWEVQCKQSKNKERLAPKMVMIEKKNLLSSATGTVFKNRFSSRL